MWGGLPLVQRARKRVGKGSSNGFARGACCHTPPPQVPSPSCLGWPADGTLSVGALQPPHRTTRRTTNRPGADCCWTPRPCLTPPPLPPPRGPVAMRRGRALFPERTPAAPQVSGVPAPPTPRRCPKGPWPQGGSAHGGTPPALGYVQQNGTCGFGSRLLFVKGWGAGHCATGRIHFFPLLLPNGTQLPCERRSHSTWRRAVPQWPLALGQGSAPPPNSQKFQDFRARVRVFSSRSVRPLEETCPQCFRVDCGPRLLVKVSIVL